MLISELRQKRKYRGNTRRGADKEQQLKILSESMNAQKKYSEEKYQDTGKVI